jgi:CheY-like chemotaxis protein
VKRILVVDDSVTMRQLMKMVLMKHLQCQITEAQDGLDALAKLSGRDLGTGGHRRQHAPHGRPGARPVAREVLSRPCRSSS